MGLNFPTAFWKKQPNSVEEFSISWETGLAWSQGNVSEANINSPLKHSPLTSPFPFNVIVDGTTEEYYESYSSLNWVGDPKTSPYYAWFLTGGYDLEGENNLSAYHQAQPWTIGATGHTLKIDFEADYDTAFLRDDTIAGTRPIRAGYNSFVQSGNATGTFTVSVAQDPATLQVKISGLGEDKSTVGGALSYDIITVYLDNDLICSGEAPGDNRNVLALSDDYDMQQVKLYAGSDLETIVNTTDSPKGEPRASSSAFVEQDTRASYTTSNGIGTFNKTNLAAGEYKIKIKASTIDGVFSSGAFYGLDFNLI